VPRMIAYGAVVVLRMSQLGRVRVASRAMKAIYKPFGLIMGLASGLVASKIFGAVWGIFDKEEPPKPTTKETNWPKVLMAAAVQGMVFKIVRAFVDRGGAKGFEYLTGTWPGDQRQEPSAAAKAAGRR
jgi:hypothetical protein